MMEIDTLPYGRYLLEDGSFVLFNRGYQPIERIYPDGRRVPYETPCWVPHDGEEFFYNDSDHPLGGKKKSEKTLAKVERILSEGKVRPGDVVYAASHKAR